MYFFVMISTIELILINIICIINYRQLNLIDIISKRLLKNEHTITFLDSDSDEVTESDSDEGTVSDSDEGTVSDSDEAIKKECNEETFVTDIQPQDLDTDLDTLTIFNEKNTNDESSNFVMNANIWNSFIQDDDQYKDALKSLAACYNTITKNMKHE